MIPIATSAFVPKLPLEISACSLGIFYIQRFDARPWAATEAPQTNPQQPWVTLCSLSRGCGVRFYSPTLVP